MSKLVKPHGGGELKPLLLSGQALAAEQKRATTLKKANVSSRVAGDIIILGIGVFTPLHGFMEQVIKEKFLNPEHARLCLRRP